MRLFLPIVLMVSLATAGGSAAAPTVPPIDPAGLPGPLVLAGPGSIPPTARQAFVELAGKDKAKIVILSAHPVEQADIDRWKDVKTARLVFLNRKSADDAALVKDIAEATGVWFESDDAAKSLAVLRGTPLEKEIRKLHARGGVLGGDADAIALFGDRMLAAGDIATAEGLGFLPGYVIDRRSMETKRAKRMETAIAANPAWVGVELEPGSALVIRGRVGQVMGETGVTIHVAKGAGRPAASDRYPVDAVVDLVQLRRAAANRAAKDPFPPATPPEPVVAKGTLVIVGGGAAGPDIWKTFITASGGPDVLIVVVPTAMEDPLAPESGEEKALKRFGAKNVKALHTRNPREADDPKFSEPLTKAGGVWFSGGRQWRFVDAYAGTLTEKRFHEVLARGGAIGGSSAGASIQSEYMPRGHPLGNTVMAAEGYERGFGFLPGCAVDQHFFTRKRTADMTGLMKRYPQYLGIGLDEGTAIVVRGHVAEVIGRSKVAFYDTRAKPSGDRDYQEVQTGEKYDLQSRQKLEK